MEKIKFQKDISVNDLYDLINSYNIDYESFYTIVSINTFVLLSGYDFEVVGDMREQGLGYIWYSYRNFIHIITDKTLLDDELIYLKKEDMSLFLRKKKIEQLKNKH